MSPLGALALVVGLWASDPGKLVDWARSPGTQSRVDLARALAEAELPRLSTAVLTEVLVLDRKKPQDVGRALAMYPISLRGDPPPARVLGALSAAPVGNMNEANRAIRQFIVGQALLAAGQPRAALAQLEQVAPGSPAYAPARFLMGVAWVTPPHADLQKAGLAFQEAIVEAETSPQRARSVVQDARRLSLLNLARLYHEVGKGEVALYYYRRLPRSAPERVAAEFESAWVHLLRGDMHRALGAVHGARAPGARHPDRAELHLVAAAALMGLCQHDLGKAELERLKDAYLVHAKTIGEAREQAAVADEKTVLGLIGRSSSLPQTVVDTLLEQPAIRSAQAEADAIDAEMERLKRIAVNHRLDLAVVLARGEGLKQAARARLVSAIRDALAAKAEEWGRLEAAYDELVIDLLDHEAGELERQIRTGRDVEAIPAEAQAPALGEDWQRWEFTGEWWPDELGYFRSTLPSLCELRDIETPVGEEDEK